MAVPHEGMQLPEGVIISSISINGVAAASKKLRPGDGIHALNGVQVTGYEQACSLLREAEGVLQLVVTRGAALPAGWEELKVESCEDQDGTKFQCADLYVTFYYSSLKAEKPRDRTCDKETQRCETQCDLVKQTMLLRAMGAVNVSDRCGFARSRRNHLGRR